MGDWTTGCRPPHWKWRLRHCQGKVAVRGRSGQERVLPAYVAKREGRRAPTTGIEGQMKRVIVLSEERLTESLVAGLRQLGYAAEGFTSPEAALTAISRRQHSVAIVDVDWNPRSDLFLQRFRETDPLLALIVLTGYPTWENAVRFLSGGAAALALDYIGYIIMPEARLLEKLDEMLRRYAGRVEAGAFRVELATGRAWYHEREFALTPTEFNILAYFVTHPLTEVEYEDIARVVYGRSLPQAEAVRSLKAHMSRLHDKLKMLAGRREVIKTRRVRDDRRATLLFEPDGDLQEIEM